MKFAGVDACRKGWFLVSISKQMAWETCLFFDIENLWQKYHDVSLLLIDIPIGLPYSRNRRCDIEARKVLKKRASSVFPAPSREAINSHKYKEACAINCQILGKKISKQTWNISHKIKEVDDFLIANNEARIHFRESHPEICFWALAGGNPMRFNKKTKQGINERLHVLQLIYPESKMILNSTLTKYNRSEISRDDILDALALTITASSPYETLATFPTQPDIDLKALPMEIVYTTAYI